MPKIWVGRTTLNGEKKEDGLTFSSLEGTTNWSDSHTHMNVLVQVFFGLKLLGGPLEEALGRNRSKGRRELILPADAP